MAINLSKGQKVDLTKTNPGLTLLMVGLGWDQVKKGLFSFGAKDVDCDSSVLMLDENGTLQDIVYFAQLKSKCQSVTHKGDNLTGAGAGDDEQIFIDLSKVPSNVTKLVFIVNIYQCIERKQDFGKIQNAFIRVVDNNKNSELVRFNLSEDYQGLTTLFTGEIYRHDGEWKFNAVGEGTRDTSLQDVISKYR